MKSKVVYICSECGARSPKWLGKCHNCGAWESFTEARTEGKLKLKQLKSNPSIIKLREIEFSGENRLTTGISELDRVVGGGIIPGSVLLLGGDPGIGKSTLTLQLCGSLHKINPLYVSGEESVQQLKHRAERLNDIPGDLLVLSETNVEAIEQAISSVIPGLVVIDSIQSVSTDKSDASPGSILQVRESAALLSRIAKQNDIPFILIGHVTKEGVIAGPKLLEHMVDAVLQFEGEQNYSYRILRSIKNRFGSTNEIGVFEMNSEGLKEVPNPSSLFLDSTNEGQPGVAIVATVEGSRPILHEIQALVTPSGYGTPQRNVNGFDMRRLNLILAVLEKRLGANYRQFDVFVNVTGGVYINDPSIDLGIAAALMSSYSDTPVERSTVMFGEIGLTGELRQVGNTSKRISESVKLGFRRIVAPTGSDKNINKSIKANILTIERISLAIPKILGNGVS